MFAEPLPFDGSSGLSNWRHSVTHTMSSDSFTCMECGDPVAADLPPGMLIVSARCAEYFDDAHLNRCQTLSANRVGFRLCHICIGDALLDNLPNLPDEGMTKVKRQLAWFFKNNLVCFRRQTTLEMVD